jgi:hypothetical protein
VNKKLISGGVFGSVLLSFCVMLLASCGDFLKGDPGAPGQDGTQGVTRMDGVVRTMAGLSQALAEEIDNIYIVESITIPKGTFLEIPSGTNLFVTTESSYMSRSVGTLSASFSSGASVSSAATTLKLENGSGITVKGATSKLLTLEGGSEIVVVVYEPSKFWFSPAAKLEGEGTVKNNGSLILPDFKNLNGIKFEGEGTIKIGDYADKNSLTNVGKASELGTVTQGSTLPASINAGETFIWISDGSTRKINQTDIDAIDSGGRLIVHGVVETDGAIDVQSKNITFNTLSAGGNVNITGEKNAINELRVTADISATFLPEASIKSIHVSDTATLTIIGAGSSLQIESLYGKIKLPDNWTPIKNSEIKLSSASSSANVTKVIFSGSTVIDKGIKLVLDTDALLSGGDSLTVDADANSAGELEIHKNLFVEGDLTLNDNSIVKLIENASIQIKETGTFYDKKDNGGTVWASDESANGKIVFYSGAKGYIYKSALGGNILMIGGNLDTGAVALLTSGAIFTMEKSRYTLEGANALLNGPISIGSGKDVKELVVNSVLAIGTNSLPLPTLLIDDGALLSGTGTIIGSALNVAIVTKGTYSITLTGKSGLPTTPNDTNAVTWTWMGANWETN